MIKHKKKGGITMNITGRSGTAAVGIGKEEYSKHSNSSSVVVATVVVVAKTIMMTAVFFIAQAVCVTCRFRGAGRGVAFGYFSLVHCCCPVLLVAVAAYTIIMAAKDASGTMWGVFQLFFIVLCLIPICYFSIHSFTFFCFCHSFLPALSSFVICLLFFVFCLYVFLFLLLLFGLPNLSAPLYPSL